MIRTYPHSLKKIVLEGGLASERLPADHRVSGDRSILPFGWTLGFDLSQNYFVLNFLEASLLLIAIEHQEVLDSLNEFLLLGNSIVDKVEVVKVMFGANFSLGETCLHLPSWLPRSLGTLRYA